MKNTKLKDILNESVLGQLPSEQMFKYNKATGKYEAPGKHSTNEEIEEQLNEAVDRKYYIKQLAKIYTDLEDLEMELSNDEEISDVHHKWLFGHIETAKISLDKLEKTMGKL